MTASIRGETASRDAGPAPERASGSASSGAPEGGGAVVRGWDPVVRLTHWGIAAAVLANGLITTEGSASHIWIGHGALALLLTRLLWGMVGTDAARFSSFPPSPRGALSVIGDVLLGHRPVRHRRRSSHNPVGALMAYALWACLAVVTVSGIAMPGSLFGGDFEAHMDGTGVLGYAGTLPGDEEEGILSEIHEVAATLLFWLATLHVFAVAAHGYFGDSGVIRAMLIGASRRDSDSS